MTIWSDIDNDNGQQEASSSDVKVLAMLNQADGIDLKSIRKINNNFEYLLDLYNDIDWSDPETIIQTIQDNSDELDFDLNLDYYDEMSF